MKKLTLIVMAASMMTAVGCGNSSSNAENHAEEDSVYMLDGPGSVYTPTEHDLKMADMETQKEMVSQRVKEIYNTVNQVYAHLDDGGVESGTDLDALYCSADWRKTVKAVGKKDIDNGGMGFFDADYWVMGQDFDNGNISVSDIKIDHIDLETTPWCATATFMLHNFSPISVRLDFVYEEDEWKVDNMIDQSDELNWKECMKEYLAE